MTELPDTMTSVIGRQVDALLRATADGREVLVITVGEPPEAISDAADSWEVQHLDGFLAADPSATADEGSAPALVLLCEVPRGLARDTGLALQRRVAAGHAVVAMLSPAIGKLVVAAVPEAVVLEQLTVEATMLSTAEERAQGVSLVLPDPVPRRALEQLVLLGGPAMGIARAQATATGGAVHAAHRRALGQANAELRRANARLAVETVRKESAAAAAALGREVDLAGRVRWLEERLEAADERLAVEIEVANQNDRNFQNAREQLIELYRRPSVRYPAAIRSRVRAMPALRRVARVVRRLRG